MPHKQHHYGWVPDRPDHRDHVYATPRRGVLPLRVDLRRDCPPVYNQGPLESCTANAIAAAIQFDQKKRRQKTFVPSRLFIFYNERSLMGVAGFDVAAPIRDGIKSVAKQGVCDETEWRYDITKFAEQPTQPCYAAALHNKVADYQRIAPHLEQFKGCLAEGVPFVFGFYLYESFHSQAVMRTGHASMPSPSEQFLGGHAVLCVGYDDINRCFIVRNSWGATWGLQGYFTLPYGYLTDQSLATDFWTIRAA